MKPAPVLLVLLVSLLLASTSASALRLTLIAVANDPRLERARLERAHPGQPGGSAADGLRLALSDAEMELAAAGITFDLEVLEVADAGAARAAAAQAEKSGALALVTDLPTAWTLAVADATSLPVLNTGDASDALREAECRRNLWHLLPSERMRADALAQNLVARRWQNVLLLTGPLASDSARGAAAQAAIQRYGLKLVANKSFKLSADPRERDLANPLLLSQGSYDVVWVVDSDGEFATLLPFRTALPRPVVGDAGWVALAWSARFERYGAPQLSRRMAKAARRPMLSQDWAAWVAGKVVVAAAVAMPKMPKVAKGAAPASAAFTTAFATALAQAQVDGSKGTSLSFRPWDGQLRQPLLLSDGQAVQATAPADAVLHPRDRLDTLGADGPEKRCKARQ